MRTLLKNLKTTILGLGAAFLFLLATPAQASLSYYSELGTSFTPREAGSGLGSYLYLSGSYKFSDDWSAGVENLTSFTYRAAGVNDFDTNHGYIRVPVTRRNLNWVKGWKTSLLSRWTVPTTAGTQQAGGFGAFLLRPTLSREFGKFGVTLRPQVGFALVDRAYQKFVLPGSQACLANPADPSAGKTYCKAAGNSLFNYALEFFPSYKLNEKMSLTLLSAVSRGFTGGAPGKDGVWSAHNLSYDLWLDLPVKPAGFNLWVGAGNKTTLNGDFSIWNSQTSAYSFYVSKSF